MRSGWTNLLLETGGVVQRYFIRPTEEREELVWVTILCFPDKLKSPKKIKLESVVCNSSEKIILKIAMFNCAKTSYFMARALVFNETVVYNSECLNCKTANESAATLIKYFLEE